MYHHISTEVRRQLTCGSWFSSILWAPEIRLSSSDLVGGKHLDLLSLLISSGASLSNLRHVLKRCKTSVHTKT